MAKFISVYSSGAGLAGGDILISGDAMGCVAATATTTLIYLKGGAGADLCTITHDTVVATPSVRDAVAYALSANPGGVKAKVALPAGITVTGIAFS